MMSVLLDAFVFEPRLESVAGLRTAGEAPAATRSISTLKSGYLTSGFGGSVGVFVSGFQGLGLSGALGLTPKSQT